MSVDLLPRPATAGRAQARRAQLLLVVNPRASRVRPGDAEAVAQALRAGFAVTTVATDGRGHATQIARAAAEEGSADVVAVVGGDGTASEAAAGLAGRPTPLAVLPAGCTNVLARSLGMPRRLGPAVERLAGIGRSGDLRPRPVDLATVNGRPFVCTAGVGFSASMTATADAAPGAKARLGQAAFAAAAVSELAGRYLRRPPRMRVEGAGDAAEGITLMVQNSHALTYFGPREIRLCDAAALDSGALSITLLRRARPAELPGVVRRLVSRRAPVAGHPQIVAFPHLRTATVTAVGPDPLPLEADGEFLGEHRRIEFGVLPGALGVVA